MSTLRRIYFYLVSALSLAVVVWGGTKLLHLLAGRLAQPDALASGLAFTLAGAVVFALHWQACSHYARRSPDDRNSWERAIFLYGMLAVTLLPVVFAVITAFGEKNGDLWSVPLNLLAAAFLYSVLRADWQQPEPTRLAEVRRVSYYVWELIGLMLLLTGAYRLLFWVSDQVFGYITGKTMSLTLAFLMVGGPIWGWLQFRIQTDLLPQGTRERLHPLRVWLYLVIQLMAAILLAAAMIALLAEWVNMIFGNESWSNLQQMLHDVLPVMILSVSVGWFYRRQWSHNAVEDLAAPQRFANYVLASFGYGFLFSGLLQLTGFLVQSFRADVFLGEKRLGVMLALILVGGWLWWRFWPHTPNEQESRQRVRRFFLYFWIFIGTTGLMVTGAGALRLFLLFILGGQGGDLLDGVQTILQGVLFFATLRYYLGQLRQDQSRTHEQETVESHPLQVAFFPPVEWLQSSLDGMDSISPSKAQDAAVWVLSADAIPSDAPTEVIKLIVPSDRLPNAWWIAGDDKEAILAGLQDALRRLQRGNQPQRPGLLLWQKVLIGLGVLFALQWLFGFLAVVFSLLASL